MMYREVDAVTDAVSVNLAFTGAVPTRSQDLLGMLAFEFLEEAMLNVEVGLKQGGRLTIGTFPAEMLAREAVAAGTLRATRNCGYGTFRPPKYLWMYPPPYEPSGFSTIMLRGTGRLFAGRLQDDAVPIEGAWLGMMPTRRDDPSRVPAVLRVLLGDVARIDMPVLFTSLLYALTHCGYLKIVNVTPEHDWTVRCPFSLKDMIAEVRPTAS